MPGMFDKPNCRMCKYFDCVTEYISIKELHYGKRKVTKRQYSDMRCTIYNRQVPMCGVKQPDWCNGKFEEK